MKKMIMITAIVGMVAFLVISGFTNKPLTPNFESQVIDANIEIGYGIEIGDVDGDGKEDILLADKKQFVWYRNGDWKRFVLVDNLTDRDNVCIAARDIDGDGMVEIAVGAQWNPGETSDFEGSGSVHYLKRPNDPTELWEAVELYHVPTVHRMRWVRTSLGYQLIMLPLHGIGNKSGEGEAVQVIAYQNVDAFQDEWAHEIIDKSMHMTHNFDVIDNGGPESLLVGGMEGARVLEIKKNQWTGGKPKNMLIDDKGFGEIRKGENFIAGIQPMHGNELVIYPKPKRRTVLTSSLNQGHALAVSDLLGWGREQVVVGWREENDAGEFGIKLFSTTDPDLEKWESVWIDKNGMACEDLKVADLDGDGRLDIIASGRSTRNLKVYWNKR